MQSEGAYGKRTAVLEGRDGEKKRVGASQSNRGILAAGWTSGCLGKRRTLLSDVV